jgi:peptidoglycan/LPS O-acetylase OafA/YrhL
MLEGAKVYRPDIDGLRALAVLAIVIYHAAPDWVRGGFVGVDVFFVISGFLITGIIARERQAGTFSWRGFYLRRARRIAPAYVLVALATAAAAAWIELPGRLAPTGGALAASGLLVPNVLFGMRFDYFGPAAQQNPLLHLWSLGVEEQFYLVWPALIALLSLKLLRPVRTVLATVLLALSLAMAQAHVAHEAASWAFYGLPGRAWEFLAGGLLGLGQLPAPRGAVLANAAAGAGIALILASVFLLDEAMPFPGLTALPACLGAALVLWSGQARAPGAAALLRTAPAVGLGKVSYSFYLWHWPLLVLAADWRPSPLDVAQKLGLVAAALVLAVLTWAAVEQPLRRGPADHPGRRLALQLSPLLLLVVTGAAFVVTHGLPGRLSPAALQAAAIETTDVNPARHVCFDHPGPIAPGGCRFGAAPNAGDYDVLVWGDSHADAVTPGVIAWAQRRGWSVREAAQGGCPPLVGVRVFLPNRFELDCRKATAQVMAEIRANPKLKLVVLAARWPLYRDAPPFYDANSPRVLMTSATAPGVRPPLSQPLERTLAAIEQAAGGRAKILLVGPVPELTFAPPECLAQARHLGWDERACRTAPAGPPLARARPAEAELRAALAPHPDVRVIYPAASLCNADVCTAAMDGRPIYFDDDHLSASGARRLVPGWMDAALGGG